MRAEGGELSEDYSIGTLLSHDCLRYVVPAPPSGSSYTIASDPGTSLRYQHHQTRSYRILEPSGIQANSKKYSELFLDTHRGDL